MRGELGLQGVLLDVDGTLVDSNDLHAHAWVDALAEQDITVSFADVRHAIGMGGDKLLPQIAHIEKDSPIGEKASKRRGEIFQAKYLTLVKPFPQTAALLRRMKDSGLRLVVASSSEEEEASALLQIAGASDLIDAMSTAKDAGNSKPAPQPIQVALDKAGLAPAHAIMLGDTPYDIEAAEKAGVRVIALRTGGWSDHDLHGAAAIYDSPAELLMHIDQSPLGTGNAFR